MHRALLFVSLAACGGLPDEVLLTGNVAAAPGASEGLSGASLTVYDEAGTVRGQAQADANGDFELLAPAGDVVFVDIEAEGYVAASFAGVVGVQEQQPVEAGAFYGISSDTYAEWEATFAGCPGLGEGGGASFGEVRISNLTEPDSDEHPTVATAVVTIDDGEGNFWEACYLDEDGLAYDPDAEWTGESGRFAVFGVPAGELRISVSYEVFDGNWSTEDYPVRVPEGGVAPQFPLWTDFDL